MALQVQETMKCPSCGAKNSMHRIGLGQYKCEYCDCTAIAQGDDPNSLIIILPEARWQQLHEIVKANGTDESLLEVQLELNKSIPVNLESEIQDIDPQAAKQIKTEISALASELSAFTNKGKTWERLCEVVLRVVYCRSLIDDFDTVAHVMAEIKDCSAVSPRSWVKLYKNYYADSRTSSKDLSILLSVERIKGSLKGRDEKYDELAFYDFAENLAKIAENYAKTGNNDQFMEFYVDFISATLDDADFVKEVYPTGKLFKSRTLRQHVKTLNKYYIKYSKRTEGGK